MKIKKVYIASPLFNDSEKDENKKIDEVLMIAGYDTFLPQRDGFLYTELMEKIKNNGYSQSRAENIALNLILHLDIYNVCEGCDATVLNLNGRVPDEGAVSEGALCFRSRKPLTIYKNDARSLVNGKDNPLVVGLTEFRVITEIKKIPAELKRLEQVEGSVYDKTIRIARDLFEGKNIKDLESFIKIGVSFF